MDLPFFRTAAEQWWHEWWSRDYSWDGLRRHRPSRGDGTLQEYWRRGAGSNRQAGAAADEELDREMLASGELVLSPEGTVWHLAHVPNHWRDGSEAKVSSAFDKALLKSLLEGRLSAASAGARAELEGVVCAEQLAHSHPKTQVEANLSRSFIVSVSPGQSYGTVDFARAYFQRFDSAGSRFRGRLNFDRAIFEHGCSFAGALFDREVTFRRSAFLGDAVFTSSGFDSAAAFSRARFGRSAHFGSARIGEGSSFGAVFRSTPNFSGAQVHPSVSFNGLQVVALSQFRPLPWAIGLGAILFAVSILLGLSLSPWIAWPGVVVLMLAAAIIDPMATTEEMDLEAGRARVLMDIAAKNRNHMDEALFFRLQLKAMRVAVIRSSRSPGRLAEQVLGSVYEAVSDYGLSVLRPLGWLLIVWVAFAVGYYAWESGGLARLTLENASFVDALTFSGSRMLPVGPWAELASADGGCSFSERLLHSGVADTSNGQVPCAPSGHTLETAASVAAHRLAVIAVSAFQSLFAIVLFFLEGLAVRRRFQIG